MLQVNDIDVTYMNIIQVLRGVSLEVADGKIVALLGANGAGKTTTLKAISGMLKTEEGKVTNGSIVFDGKRIDRYGPGDIAALGITQVMEGRRVLEHLTTEENLLVFAHRRKDRKQVKSDIDMVFSYFPKIKERRHQRSGYLSGGEQQMLVIGRGLMARPKLMLLDEPSLGLAPLLVKEIYEIIRRINAEQKMSILLVEQNARAALNTFGSTGSLIVASMNNYLTSIGYDLVDTNPHFVTSGPGGTWDAGLALASLQWCQANNISLTLGAMVANPAEQMMNLANSLGIGAAGSGHNNNFTMQIALSSPAHPVMIQRDAIYNWGDIHLADGLVVAGSYPSWNDTALGVDFSKTLQNTYRPGQGVTYNATAYALSHVMYQHGVVEAMVQVEAIRLAMSNTGKAPCDLMMSDIFTQGFLKINGLSTGGIIPGIINYSTGKVEGAQYVRVDQCWNGTVILLGDTFPIRPNLW